MKRFSVLVSLILVSFLVGVGVTYVATSTAWVSDMANQPSIKAQEMPFEAPPGAVPVGLTEIILAAHQSKPAEPPKQEATAPAGGHHGGAAPTGPDHHGGATPAPKEHHGGAAPTGPDHHGGATPAPKDHHGGAAPAGPDHHGGATPAPTDQQGGASPSPQGHHGGAAPTGPGQHGGASPAAKDHHGSASPAGEDHNGLASSPSPGGHGSGHSMAMGHGPQLVNPVKSTAASIKEGKSLFGVYCSVCHGAKGQGGMPIAAKYPKIPKFTQSLLQQTPDSHMFSMLTSGHGPMPGYAEALSGSERWNVINYLRDVQKEL